MDNRFDERKQMVEEQLRSRGITNQNILNAFLLTPREDFIPAKYKEKAYQDRALPLGEGQTVSQPYIVAVMLNALDLKPGSGAYLEIGTGSGYAAALLSQLADQVYTIERHKSLSEGARLRLKSLGYQNVEVITGDGTLGLPQRAPFDGIIVSAGGPHLPENLLRQLRVGGRLIMPIGPKQRMQTLVQVSRTSDSFVKKELGPVQFVPLIGSAGWRREK